jgi:hypothetical protein
VAEGDKPEEGSDEWLLTATEVDDMRRGINRDRMSSDRSPHRGVISSRIDWPKDSLP